MERVFNPEAVSVQTVQGYNCVDAMCRILRLEDGTQLDTRIFKQDQLIIGMIKNGLGNMYLDMEVLVAADYKTPARFYSKLQSDKYWDEYAPLDFIGELSVAGVVIVGGVVGILVGMFKLLDFLFYYF